MAAVLVLAGHSGHETKSGGHGSRKKSIGDREVADFSLRPRGGLTCATMEELLERLKRRTPVHVKESPAEILRAERERRDRR